MLGITGTLPQIVNVDGRRAWPARCWSHRRSLRSDERAQFDQQTDADRNDAIGTSGVRRIHSRSFDTSRLSPSHHPDVEYAEPNYIIQADAT